MIGDKNHISGNVNVDLFDTQEKVDGVIYNQRVNTEDTKLDETVTDNSSEMKEFYAKCEQLDVEVLDDEVRINKRYYKKDEIDHWVTTPNGTHIPIPKEGKKGYRKIFEKPSKGGKALVAIAQGKKRPPTQREVKERVGKLPLGHVETKAGKLPKHKKFAPMISTYSVQRHLSEKAPDHHDLRLKMGNKAYSWAVTKWPNPGEKQLAVLQPAHSIKYMNFKGIIPRGQYGAGRVDLIDHNKVEITDWGKKKIAFNVYEGQNKGRYALIDVGDKNFLLVRKTRIRKYPEIEYHPARARVKFREEMWDSPKYVVQPKMNGARYLLYVGGKNGNQLLSRGMSEVEKGHHVDQTDNVPHLRDIKFEQKDLVLDGEIFRGDKTTTASIMNSNPLRSRELQKKHGKVTYYVFDILKYNGNDLRNLPYKMRLKFLERAVGKNKYPNIKVIPSFTENKKAYYRHLVKMGYEGVVFKRLDGRYGDRFMTKMKPVYDEDYVIMGYTPGKGKFKGMFGAIEYGKYIGGKLTRVGKVGSGFSEKQRVEINKKIDRYIKQKKVIAIKHLGKTHKGTPEASVFDRIRESKTWHDMFSESAGN
jgi:DNA ligase D-like protein (predicted 3'-phosphoesterase)